MARKKEATDKAEAARKKEIMGYVVTEGGKKYEVISETWKYWICKNNQFRKSNKKVVFKKRKDGK
jgi:hypothetical protein